MRGGESPPKGASTLCLHSQIRFLRLIEKEFKSVGVQLAFEVIERTAMAIEQMK